MEKNQIATLGGGCFWCLEAVFQEIAGVKSVISGYAGGHTPTASYREVCSGKTGHAEVIQLVFNPDEVSYERLLEVFFNIHDPTTPNRQGADVGSEYRSIILVHNQEQREAAERVRDKIEKSGIWPGRLVTEIEEVEDFHIAEKYHQNFYRDNPSLGYCLFRIDPKLEVLRARFPELLRSGAEDNR